MENNLPQGWIVIPFTELLDIQGGTQPPKNTFKYEPTRGYIRLLQIRDFGEKPLPTFIKERTQLKTCEEDDVLIARYGASIGRIVTGMKGAYNVALAKVVIPKPLNKNFIKYLLKSEIFQRPILSIQRSAQDGFNKEDLAEIEIPVAPLAEQHRIVAKLDALFEKIESNKQRLEKIPKILKRFRQSVLAAAVSGKLTEEWREKNGVVEVWDIVMLEDLISEGPQNGMYKPLSAYGNGIMILRIDNFYDGEINPWTTLKKLRVEGNEFKLYSLQNDDIVVNRVNSMPYLGKSALVKNLTEKCVFESNMMRMKLKKDLVSPLYLIKYLNSMSGLEELRKNAKHAVNQSSINQQDVKAVEVPLPKLEEQGEIVKRVEQLFAFADKLEARYNKAKAMLDKLPQSILAKAFRGELVAQDPNDEPASVLLEKIKAEKEKLAAEKKGKKSKEYSIEEKPLKIAAEKKVKYNKRKPL